MILREITPESLKCGIGACPAIFATDRGTFVLIGKVMPSALPPTLVGRVGADETVVEIPAQLLEKLGLRREGE